MIAGLVAAGCLIFLMVRYVSLSRRLDRHQEAMARIADLILILQKQDLELLQTIRLLLLTPTTHDSTAGDDTDNDIQ
jgi:hypothetical protein